MSKKNDSLAIGDVVHLKSGSDKMTIVKLVDSRFEVCWYANGQTHCAVLPREALVKIG